MWSFGCLLHEVLTGSKLFRAGASFSKGSSASSSSPSSSATSSDRLAAVLRPSQLVEMRAGDTEADYAERGLTEVFKEVKDLVRIADQYLLVRRYNK